jgi:hypothetical protein
MSSNKYGHSIDISGVPVEKRGDLDFLQKFNHLTRVLADPRQVEIGCTHDAGHLIYFRRAGIPTENIKFHGPTVFYNPQLQEFLYFLACVEPPFDCQVQIDAFAKGAAAGGVFSSVLCHETYRGDEADLDLFTRIANRWLQRNLHLWGLVNIESLWREAQQAVEADLRDADATFHSEIAAAIAEIKARCLRQGV